jgi:signal transduction histidine kinase
MKRAFFIVLVFYLAITAAGIAFMGTRLYVVKERVESLIVAQKSLFKRMELRDAIYDIEYETLHGEGMPVRIEGLKERTNGLIKECYGCHHSQGTTAYIREIERRFDNFRDRSNINDFFKRPEKILVATREIIPLVETAYIRAKSLADVKLNDAIAELEKVKMVGGLLILTGLSVFSGFSVLSLRKIARLEADIKERQQRLAQSEKLAAMGHLIAVVAHELSNPLSAINGFSELILHGSPDENIRNAADKIGKSAERANAIVRDLLVFSRTPKLEPAVVKIKDIAGEAAKHSERILKANNIAVSVDVPDDISMPLDKAQMERVLLNLITNAAHAIVESKKGDRIAIRAYKEGKKSAGRVIIEVADNGPGIPHDIVNRIFEPFFTTKKFEKGTGLGLSICYNIVDAHGGGMSVKSREGEGAVFIIEFILSKILKAPFPYEACSRPDRIPRS